MYCDVENIHKSGGEAAKRKGKSSKKVTFRNVLFNLGLAHEYYFVGFLE